MKGSLERRLYCLKLLRSGEIDLVEENDVRCCYLALSFVVDALGSWISELLRGAGKSASL
jgi:hypothetical protein